MPKCLIKYQNTIIYKIVCNDLNISDCYVGHTTNFTKRKAVHKTYCNNENKDVANSQIKIYKIIRENGGWNNWNMIEIEKFSCNDSNEARARERYWYEKLEPNLNTFCPLVTTEEGKIKHQKLMKNWHCLNKEVQNKKQNEYNKIY